VLVSSFPPSTYGGTLNCDQSWRLVVGAKFQPFSIPARRDYLNAFQFPFNCQRWPAGFHGTQINWLPGTISVPRFVSGLPHPRSTGGWPVGIEPDLTSTALPAEPLCAGFEPTCAAAATWTRICDHSLDGVGTFTTSSPSTRATPRFLLL